MIQAKLYCVKRLFSFRKMDGTKTGIDCLRYLKRTDSLLNFQKEIVV